MWRVWFLGVLVACTKANPAAVCATGTCIDPAYPFCDVDGTISGTAGSCVAVTCTPGMFGACRGDNIALTCNAAGTSYDSIQCPLGCDPTLNGCRLCEPNQTVCANGTVASCDANGNQTSSACPLGCFEDQPRCRDIDPSNGLAKYFDMVSAPPDLKIAAGSFGRINTATGAVEVDGVDMPFSTFVTSAPIGGIEVRVVVVRRMTVSGYMDTIGAPALAILATDDITIDGNVVAHAGNSLDLGCAGGKGVETDNGVRALTAASGGGGFATPGAAGGNITSGTGLAGGLGGGVCGNAALVPLRGGGASGGTDTDNGEDSRIGVGGGGAVQLVSRTHLSISGVITLDGASGDVGQVSINGYYIYGGGAGGALLLEAPVVELSPVAAILARGGGGAANGPFVAIVNDANPIPGAGCSAGLGVTCGAGGAGAAPAIASHVGSNGLSTGAGATSGGGGGGLGRMRINTPDGTYTKSNTTIEAAAVTTGMLNTR